MDEIIEYPKSLYAKGWDDLSATVIVNSKEEEDAARAEGYKGLADPVEAPKTGKAAKAE